MQKKFFVFALLFLCLGILTISAAGCGGGGDDDSSDDVAVDDDSADDTTDDTVGDDTSGDDTGSTWPGSEEVTISTPNGDVVVSLNGLPMVTYIDPDTSESHPAVAIAEVVNAAFTSKDFSPADYKYNFIATDSYDILDKKLDGDFRGLPSYDNLALGWFIEYDEQGKYIDIEAVWDQSLSFPNFMKAKMMDGGTIEMVENVLFSESVTVNVTFASAKDAVAVDLQGMPAFDSDGTQAVWLHLIVLEAALDAFDPSTYDYAFNFIATDSFNLLDHITGLGGDVSDLPLWQDFTASKDIHHGWIKYSGVEADGYQIYWDDVTGFPGSYSVKLMDGGTIEIWDITP